MKKWIFLSFLTITTALVADPVCKKCEVIREYNKKHPGDYEYYDDYIKAQSNKKEEMKKPTSSEE